MSGTGTPARLGAGSLADAGADGLAGLAIAGLDIAAAIAAETDLLRLRDALELARRGHEKRWATQLARRLHEIEGSATSALRLAALLAASGDCADAAACLAQVPPDHDPEPRSGTLAVILAKTGRADEALALFDRLPGAVPGQHPAPLAIATAEQMVEQCAIGDAEALLAPLAQRYPSHLLIRALQLRCALYAGDVPRTRELSQMPDAAVLAQKPRYDRRYLLEAIAETLGLSGRANELFDFARDRIVADRSHWSMYDRAASAARIASREREFAALVEAIPADLLVTPEALTVLCRWHTDENRPAAAADALARIRPASATLYLECSLYCALYGRDPQAVEAAYHACEAGGVPMLGAATAHAIHTYYYNCSVERLRACIARLAPFRHSRTKHPFYWQAYLRCLVGVGDSATARRIYESLPAGLAGSAVLGPFRMYFAAALGRHEEAKQGWRDFLVATGHLCINAPSSYPATLRLRYRPRQGAVLLFTTLRDAADYLDWFLGHYRALGVDHFFIVDNGSADGTTERLCAEPDVSVFSNPRSFARSAFGVIWINHLIQRFGVGHWCFYVDSDEGFVFPRQDEGRSLSDLLAYCDRYGFASVPAIELDMYPADLDQDPATNAFAASCHFDTDYVSVPSEIPPYVSIQGGIRQRMTGLALSMHKSPLVRVAADTRYIECNHATTHLPVADLQAALLHYKFVGDVRRRIDAAVAKGEHFAGAVTYRRLGGAIDQGGAAEPLLSPWSRRYEGPKSLLTHGLTKTNSAWDAFRSHRR
jgi:hypothetical protein